MNYFPFNMDQDTNSTQHNSYSARIHLPLWTYRQVLLCGKLFQQMWKNYSIISRLNDETEAHRTALLLNTMSHDGLCIYNSMQFPGKYTERLN